MMLTQIRELEQRLAAANLGKEKARTVFLHVLGMSGSTITTNQKYFLLQAAAAAAAAAEVRHQAVLISSAAAD